MIARVVTGKIRSDVDHETKQKYYADALKACLAQKACRGAFFMEPPDGEEGVVAVILWDSFEEGVIALGGPLQGGFATWGRLLREPPRGKYYPVVAAPES
jgi:hypothetical protein